MYLSRSLFGLRSDEFLGTRELFYVKFRSNRLFTYAFLLDTVFPLGILEAIVVASKGRGAEIFLQGITHSTGANVGVLNVTIKREKVKKIRSGGMPSKLNLRDTSSFPTRHC
jgi:hypothetical protein